MGSVNFILLILIFKLVVYILMICAKTLLYFETKAEGQENQLPALCCLDFRHLILDLLLISSLEHQIEGHLLLKLLLQVFCPLKYKLRE